MYQKESRITKITGQVLGDVYALQCAYGKAGHEKWLTLEGEYKSLADAAEMCRMVTESNRRAGCPCKLRVAKIYMTAVAKAAPAGDYRRLGLEPPPDAR